MSRGVKEDKAAARGMYYYRGRYWSALSWSRLNRPADPADAPLPVDRQRRAVAEVEETPERGPRQKGQPLTAAGR